PADSRLPVGIPAYSPDFVVRCFQNIPDPDGKRPRANLVGSNIFDSNAALWSISQMSEEQFLLLLRKRPRALPLLQRGQFCLRARQFLRALVACSFCFLRALLRCNRPNLVQVETGEDSSSGDEPSKKPKRSTSGCTPPTGFLAIQA